MRPELRPRYAGAHYRRVERPRRDWDAALFPVVLLLFIALVVLLADPTARP